MSKFYKDDLAFIHDVGFAGFALQTAPGILDILRKNKINDGLVVDLGCGSGLLAKELIGAGYQALGIDISESMIRLARGRVPEAEFRVASLLQTEIPNCRAVTSISECLNYLFDSSNSAKALSRLFRRIYKALLPGGIFIFDILEPGQFEPGSVTKGFTEGEAWTVLVEKSEDHKRSRLTRRIITFRKIGKQYRRGEEVHEVQLYRASDLAEELRRAGFQVSMIRKYGELRLAKNHAAFVARKAK
jgi:SAM-dependent methyltransferase